MISHQAGAQAVANVQLTQGGGALTGELVMPVCGKRPLSFTVSPAGQVSGTVESFDGARNCSSVTFIVTGQVSNDALQINMRAPFSKGSGTLKKQN